MRTKTISSGHAASEAQKGHKASGTRVRTKKSTAGFSGGAIYPAITTRLPCKDVSLGLSTRPLAPPPAYSSEKSSVFSDWRSVCLAPTGAQCRLSPRAVSSAPRSARPMPSRRAIIVSRSAVLPFSDKGRFPLPCVQAQGIDDREKDFGIVEGLVKLLCPRTTSRQRHVLHRMDPVVYARGEIAGLQLTIAGTLLVGDPFLSLFDRWLYRLIENFVGNTAKVALSAQVIGIRHFGDLLLSAYFACPYIASEGVLS